MNEMKWMKITLKKYIKKRNQLSHICLLSVLFSVLHLYYLYAKKEIQSYIFFNVYIFIHK